MKTLSKRRRQLRYSATRNDTDKPIQLGFKGIERLFMENTKIVMNFLYTERIYQQ